MFSNIYIVLKKLLKFNGDIMKTEKNIFIAFILNLLFAVFEFLGGIFTGSVAILSDALHDMGDALSIGISYFFEKKSKRQPDSIYTYGYVRYSVIGGLITTLILIFGSLAVIYNAVHRIFNPTEINYNGMIILSVLGATVNLIAAYFTREGASVNQKAVNLHMLEDVLGWIIVLIGAVVMKFTDFSLIDPILSVTVAVFILINAIKNLKEIFEILLQKVPDGVSLEEIKEHILETNGISDVHHIHIWTDNGQSLYATMHIKTNEDFLTIKHKVRQELKIHGITHATLELESEKEDCPEPNCHIELSSHIHRHHHNG